jgi:hypothetical protein
MSGSESENTPSIWSNLNLPQVLLGPAGAALSRLIGKATDIPAAKLEAQAQKIKDETAAGRWSLLSLKNFVSRKIRKP